MKSPYYLIASGNGNRYKTTKSHRYDPPIDAPTKWLGCGHRIQPDLFQRTSAIGVFGLSAQKRQSLTLAPLDIFAVAFGEVGRVVDIVGVGHIPPERLEILLEFGALEHAATVGIGQVAGDAATEGLVTREHIGLIPEAEEAGAVVGKAERQVDVVGIKVLKGKVVVDGDDTQLPAGLKMAHVEGVRTIA